jgi:hypothetical protein
MKKTICLFVVATAFAAAPALADCASDLTKVKDAMATMTLDEATNTKAKELMDKASTAQTAKDETACMASAQELMTLLGVKAN